MPCQGDAYFSDEKRCYFEVSGKLHHWVYKNGMIGYVAIREVQSDYNQWVSKGTAPSGVVLDGSGVCIDDRWHPCPRPSDGFVIPRIVDEDGVLSLRTLMIPYYKALPGLMRAEIRLYEGCRAALPAVHDSDIVFSDNLKFCSRHRDELPVSFSARIEADARARRAFEEFAAEVAGLRSLPGVVSPSGLTRSTPVVPERDGRLLPDALPKGFVARLADMGRALQSRLDDCRLLEGSSGASQ